MDTVPVTLIFAEGVARTILAHCGNTVVDAAATGDLMLLTDCSNGQCGTCAATLMAGAVELGAYDRAVLPDADRAQGAILPCVSKITGPCVIEFPYEISEATAEALPPKAGRVVGIERVAEETIRLDVEIDEPLHFQPGQYVRIRPRGGDAWRSYSMANGPGSSRLVFYVRVVDGGTFSTWLMGAACLGAGVEISEPHGAFFLRDEDRPRLFVAGGTGLAPFLSMLEAMTHDEQRGAPPTTLLLGVRSGEHLFGLDRIQDYVTRLPSFKVELAAEINPSTSCRTGYATDLIAALRIEPTTRLYLCGPPPMVEAGRAAAAAVGLAREDMLCERFN